MRRANVQIELRERTKKGGARSARRDGKIPGILYGGEQEPMPVNVNRREMERALHTVGVESENILVNAQFANDNTEVLTLIRDTQHDPLTGSLDHIDFFRVSLDRPLRTSVPIHTIGNPQGVRDGGVFEVIMREVEIECLPLDIPDYVEVDVTNLQMGASMHISDIPTDPKYKVLLAKEQTIATVVAPTVVKEDTTTEAGAADAAAAEQSAKA